MTVSSANGADPFNANSLSMIDQSNSGGWGTGWKVSGNQSQGGNTFMESIMQAFSQMGISMPSASNPTPPDLNANLTSDGSSLSSGATAPAGSTQPAHHHGHGFGKFMHDLFAAVESESDSTGSTSSATSSTPASPYSSFSNKLQQLISQLEAGSGSSSSSTASSENSEITALQTDFNNLVSSLQAASGSNSANGAGSTSGSGENSSGAVSSPSGNVNLETFLQDLLSNLGSSTSLTPIGNFMNQYC